MDVGSFLESMKHEIVDRNAIVHHPVMNMIYEGELTRE